MVGRMERYGLPAPDHPFGSAHPTVSDDVLSRIAHGEITPKPNLAELGERSVRFADGSEAEADVIVYCTGYRVTFPFFDPELISAPDNDLPLFRRVFHPDVPGVYFVGLLQPLGAIMPLAELQSGWICDHLQGRYALPDRPAMLADMEAERAAMFKRYVPSKRHTMQVDFEDYVLAAKHERRRGSGARRDRRAARADEGGEPRGDRGRGARRVRRARVRGRRRARHRPPHRAGLGHVLQLLPRQGGGLPGRRRGGRGGGPAARGTARTGTSDAASFVEAGYRAYFEFIVEDPATFAFLRRNIGALGAAGLEREVPLGAAELAEDLAALVRRGALPPLDVDYAAHAMVAVGVELGARLAERDPPDVEGATGFATALVLRGMTP